MSLVDQNMEFTDFRIKCGEKIFPVHKIVLASHSPVFRRMMQTDMLEKSFGEVNIKDADPEVIKMMIKFMYTGEIDSSAEDETILRLFYLADYYLIEELKRLCEDILANPTVQESNDQNYGLRRFFNGKWTGKF